MSENVKNENTKVIIVANLKSPVVGFVLALFLGWLGVDRFYQGGLISVLLGIVKLIGGIAITIGYLGGMITWIFVGSVSEETQLTIHILFIGYILWYVLDLIFVPLGIFFDNRKKLAIAKGAK